MTVTKPEELRDLSDEEIDTKLAEAKEELFNLRFQLVTGQLDNPMAIKIMRKQIARILTVIRERELAVLEGAAAEEA
ncbi:MAG TPA: 50S ribosomal protein L29 [Actinomycetota bacterium]|nr:50S ribosomal protein L29 [Actinomycetota bacterium]